MNYKYLKRGWSKKYIFRTQIEQFTKGLIGSNYMSNIDSAGKGPKRYKIKGKIAYDINDLIEWLELRSEV